MSELKLRLIFTRCNRMKTDYTSYQSNLYCRSTKIQHNYNIEKEFNLMGGEHWKLNDIPKQNELFWLTLFYGVSVVACQSEISYALLLMKLISPLVDESWEEISPEIQFRLIKNPSTLETSERSFDLSYLILPALAQSPLLATNCLPNSTVK